MKIPAPILLALAPMLALSSCQLPGSALLSTEQFQDPAYIGTNCTVSPMGFNRQLVVRAPAVGIPVLTGFAQATCRA